MIFVILSHCRVSPRNSHDYSIGVQTRTGHLPTRLKWAPSDLAFLFLLIALTDDHDRIRPNEREHEGKHIAKERPSKRTTTKRRGAEEYFSCPPPSPHTLIPSNTHNKTFLYTNKERRRRSLHAFNEN